MSELIVISYDTRFKADEVRTQLLELRREHLIDLEDTAVVTKDENGKLKLHQSMNLPIIGAVSGGFWGLLIGTLFLNPLLGAAVGAGAGAVSGSFTDLGVNDDFMRELGSSLQNDTSAIFVLLKNASPDKLIHEMKPYGGKVLQTSLSDEDEARLREAVEGQTASLTPRAV
jgi:uncharacterized membrane protein